MGKDAGSLDQDLELTPSEKKKFDELVALLAKRGFGEQGPPRDTTFAEIERFGHRAGRLVARAIDARLVEQHAGHFTAKEPCPQCGEKHAPEEHPHEHPLQTEDGSVVLREPAFRCPPCEGDFFPRRIPLRIDGGPTSPTREDSGACGLHHPHWRETKNALFMRMKNQIFACDPHPDLP